MLHQRVTALRLAGAAYSVTQKAVHIHPTVTVLIPTLLADLKPLE